MVDPIKAEARAIEEGAHAIQNDDGSFRVRSATREELRHTVRPGIVERHGRFAIHLSCSCESGSARPNELVPCWHASLVGRRLERIGWAEWDSGYWWATNVSLAAAGIAPATSNPPRIARGACPICHSFLTVKITSSTQNVKEAAAGHRPECLEEFRRREAEAARRPALDVDLWDR